MRLLIVVMFITILSPDIILLVLKELQTLGYEATCVDDWGNVMGMVRSNAEGPTGMYNAHLDHVDIGDPSEWGGYDPYGGEIDVAEVENQTGDRMEMAEVIHGRPASDTKGGMACQIYSGAILIRLPYISLPWIPASVALRWKDSR